MNDSFDLQGAALPKQFELGCLSIANGDKWRLSHVVWEGTTRFVGATFFCDLKAPWDNRNLFRIEAYKLPSGASDLAERIDWYTKGRKSRRIKIADGQLFDEGMLAIECFGDEWDSDAFALSKGEVIRIYQAKKTAVIFRFLARSGTLLDHPIFKRLVKDITIEPSGWEKKAPSITERKKKTRILDDALSPKDARELQQIAKSVEKRLGITKAMKASRRLEVVEAEIEVVRGEGKLSADVKNQLALELGVEIGECFRREMGWEWRQLTYPKNESMICICCPERRLVLRPSAWVIELLTAKSRPINCLLTFNMIESGRLPPTRPGAYSFIN
jgi:hypothetical protein